MEWQQTQEDDLDLVKGCLSGIILAIPIWVFIIVVIKYILNVRV